MSLETKKFYTLLAVAYGVAKDLREGNENIEYYLHLAIEGYREFQFDQSCEVKAVEIEMKAWKQIDLPCNAVDWVRVAFKCGDSLKILTQDTYIPKTFDKVGCTPQENKPCPSIAEVPYIGEMVPFNVYGGYGWDVAKYYGMPLDYNYLGYFDVDWTNRVINFKQTVTGFEKVYLEYISDGLEASGLTVINPYAWTLLKDWVKWQRKENNDRVSAGDKARAKELYNQSVMNFMTRITHMDVDDIKEALRSGYTLTVQN